MKIIYNFTKNKGYSAIENQFKLKKSLENKVNQNLRNKIFKEYSLKNDNNNPDLIKLIKYRWEFYIT